MASPSWMSYLLDREEDLHRRKTCKTVPGVGFRPITGVVPGLPCRPQGEGCHHMALARYNYSIRTSYEKFVIALRVKFESYVGDFSSSPIGGLAVSVFLHPRTCRMGMSYFFRSSLNRSMRINPFARLLSRERKRTISRSGIHRPAAATAVTISLILLRYVLKTVSSTCSFLLQLTPVGTTVFQGLRAVDKDTGVNGQVEYHIVKGEPPSEERLQVADGSEHFAINLPHQGQITVAKELDYEKVQRYLLTVIAIVSLFSVYWVYLIEEFVGDGLFCHPIPRSRETDFLHVPSHNLRDNGNKCSKNNINNKQNYSRNDNKQ
ncbi:unnamed protein product [Nesidiocoris tenuis]|uniref:Cadherin domain-containing protein n=1 Tax=Nesidiocoris tenuis TaxID=355587 RepID=A0A6H5HJ74_9HEMI|nr:unnamed protein product [Nesidiocoris tenuis]